MKILFLDIDGVLLSGRALVLTQNTSLSSSRHSVKENALSSTFDPCAVALVNRLCEKTGSRIVVHSNWRRNVGFQETRDKLIEQGISKDHFHDNWACQMRLTSEKCHDITDWLDDNRLTPAPESPGFMLNEPISSLWTARQKKAARDYYRACCDYGIEAVIIDDESIRVPPCHLVQTDYMDGLTIEAYRLACSLLGAEDPAMGVFPVTDADMIQVLSSFRGDKMAAIRWLHIPTPGSTMTEALRLDEERMFKRAEAYSILGYGSDPKGDARSVRNGALQRLEAAGRAHRRQSKRSSTWKGMSRP